MMKRKRLMFMVFGLILASIVIFVAFAWDFKSEHVIAATVNRDCAPWDGSAFTVQIPWEDGGMIDVSIWQAPEINFSKSFSFPDYAGQVETVILNHPSGLPDSLAGEVWLRSVSEGMPIEGRFNLTSE